MFKISLKFNYFILLIAIFLVGTFYTSIDTLTYKINSDVKCVMQFIDGGPTCLYYHLAKAFEHGQLSLLEKPSPQLLNSSTPYIFMENHQYKILDMSFYQGKYYAYFGPTNTLPILLWHAFNSKYIITDGTLNYIWSIGLLMLMAIFFNFFCNKTNIQNLFCSKSIDHHLPFSLALFGFFLTTINAGMVNCLLLRRFYEAAITGGAFFFWLAIVILLYALSSINTNKFPKTPAKIYGLFVYSGLALLLSYFAAPSNSIAMLFLGIIIPLILLYYYKNNPNLNLKKLAKCVLSFEIPLALTLILSFIYNYKRFNSIFENGFFYAISGTHFNNRKIYFGIKNLVASAYLYFFQPPLIINHFPFIIYKEIRFPYWLQVKHFYVSFGAIGLVWEKLIILPIFCFFCLIIIKLAINKIRANAASIQNKSSVKISTYLGSLFLLISLLQMTPFLLFFTGDERYMAHFNFAFGVSLLFFTYSLINYIQLIYGTGLRIVFATCFYLTGLLSILLVVFSLFGYNELFGSLVKKSNPTFYNTVEYNVNKIIQTLPLSHFINVA